jgi:hypothetical protein
MGFLLQFYENITYVVEYPDEEKEKMKNRQ